MLVDITSHLSSPLLLVLNEIIVEIIKERILLIECHELLVAHVALYVLVGQVITLVGLVDKFVQSCDPPVTERLVGRILEDKTSITIVYELTESDRKSVV